MIQHNNLSLSSDLDLNLSTTGKVVKTVGNAFSLDMDVTASGDAKVTWSKVRVPVADHIQGTTIYRKKLLTLKDCSILVCVLTVKKKNVGSFGSLFSFINTSEPIYDVKMTF